MVVAVAVADLDRHAAVEAVGYGLGAFAGFEAFNGRLVDYVSDMAVMMSLTSRSLMTLPYWRNASSVTFRICIVLVLLSYN